MVYFNNENIKIYDLDSVNSIIKRIAAKNETLPKFIYFPLGNLTIEIIIENTNIEYENLLPFYIESKSFEELYEKVNDKLELSLENIVFYYISLNSQFDQLEAQEAEFPEYKGIFIKSVLDNLNTLLKNIDPDSRIDLMKIWNNRFSNILEIKNSIKENKNFVSFQEKIFQDFDNIVGLTYTKFELEKVKFQIELDIKNMSLLEIFNNIKLNKTVPFATTQYFYKILKDFTPFVEWTNLFDRSKTYFDKYKNIDRNNNIILKILLKETKIDSVENYSEGIINYDNVFNLKLTHNLKKYDVSKKDLINEVLEVINIDSYKNEKDIDVNGVFYFPDQKLNKYVLTDLIMNDELFSSILTVDETIIGAKSTVFIYFNNTKTGQMSAYITEQKVTKNFLSTVNTEDKENFPIGSYFLRVKISKSENIKKVEYFQSILSKLFILYNEKYPEILRFYENYGIYTEFEEEPEEIKKDTQLKNIDPDIFKANYTRFCRYPPTFVTDEDLEDPEIMNYEKNGKILQYNVFEFPKETTGNSFPKKYICKHNKNIYPGLRNNPYDNADILPYIPCCYPRDQSKITGSKYRNYYFDEPVAEKDMKQQGIYVSNIILPNDSFGTLPENITRLFSTVDSKGIYYRKGMFRNKNSFLNCIMEALNDDTEILKISDENERNNYLNKIRKELIEENTVCCKQEMYDYTNEDIVNYINDVDKYFDPKLFIHILELKFNCNIFIFTKNNRGELILPRHIKSYYKLKNRNKCIFIYEHTGGESKKVEYPQCELIVRDMGEETPEYNFPYGSIISENIFNVFSKINTSYIFNKKIELIDFNIFSNPVIVPISQVIDSYGKTRLFNLLYKNITISLNTTPLPPFNIKEDVISNINFTDIHTALDLAADLSMIISSQLINENGNIKEIRGKLGNINVSIPIDGNDKEIYGIPTMKIINKNNIGKNIGSSDLVNYSDSYISVLSKFNFYKKLSRYIVEYICWLYSKFVNSNNIKEEEYLKAEVLENFKNNYIIIDENFDYGQINKTFSMTSGVMLNNKLVLKSEETLKRLFYILRLFITRSINTFKTFKDREMIEDFYVDLTDFDYYSFQVILQGEDSIIKWIDEKNKNNFLSDEIIHEKSLPYFFRNQMINNNRIYLVQNTDSYLKAQNIAIFWNNYKYNPGNNVVIEQTKIFKGMLYSYKNSKNINMYLIDGEENDYNINIIGYKIGDKSLFSVLLEV